MATIAMAFARCQDGPRADAVYVSVGKPAQCCFSHTDIQPGCRLLTPEDVARMGYQVVVWIAVSEAGSSSSRRSCLMRSR
jgi:hypothetical protein